MYYTAPMNGKLFLFYVPPNGEPRAICSTLTGHLYRMHLNVVCYRLNTRRRA